MKTRLVLLVLCLIGITNVFGQNRLTDRKVIRYVETVRESSPIFTDIRTPMKTMPVKPKTKAGIVLLYDEELPDSVKIALNYAKELWESRIPLKQPIYISVDFMPLEANTVLLSEVTHWRHSDLTGYPSSLLSQLLDSPCGGIDSPDACMLLNTNKLWNCSVNETNTTGYNITTMALRGIARALGFGSTIYEERKDFYLWGFEWPTYFEKLLYFNNNPIHELEHGTNEFCSAVTSENVYVKTASNEYKIYAPKQFSNEMSLKYFDDSNSLMSYSLGEGNTYMTIDSKTVDVLKTIGWEFSLSGLDIECKDNYGAEQYSAYVSHTYSLAQHTDQIVSYSWTFSLRNKLGIYESVATGTSADFQINPIENPDNYLVNDKGELDGKIDCRYVVDGKTYNAFVRPISLDLKPIIISIYNILTEPKPDCFFTVYFDVDYLGSDHISVNAQNENSYTKNEFTVYQPGRAHIKVEQLDDLCSNWVYLTVENDYGKVNEILEFRPGSTSANSISGEHEDAYIQIYDVTGEEVFSGRASSFTQKLEPGIYVKRESLSNGQISNSKIYIR